MADHPVNWDLLTQFANRGKEGDELLLRGVLANSLVRRGHVTVVVEDADAIETKQREGPFPTLFVLLVLWGLGAAAAKAVGAPWYLWPLGMAAAAIGLAILVQLSGQHPAVGVLIILGWLGVGVAEARSGFVPFAAMYLIPAALAVAYGIASRTLRLRDAQDVALAVGGVARGAPLVGPVVLLVLFLPALSKDVWEVADKLTLAGFIIAGVLSVGLLLLVVTFQLRRELPVVLGQRAERLSDAANRVELTRSHAAASIDADRAPFLHAAGDEVIDDAWPAAGEEYAPYLAAAEGKTLQQPLAARLALTVAVVGLLLSAYIYLLCLAVVPTDVATSWTNASIPSTDLHFLGLTVTAHAGPYLKLAGLLGLAATAAFLSFAVIEERFAAALTDALLREPADRFLVLALPYVRLRDKALTDEVAAATQPSPSSS